MNLRNLRRALRKLEHDDPQIPDHHAIAGELAIDDVEERRTIVEREHLAELHLAPELHGAR